MIEFLCLKCKIGLFVRSAEPLGRRIDKEPSVQCERVAFS